MSIEFTGIPHPQMCESTARDVLTEVAKNGGHTVVRKSDTELGLGYFDAERPSAEMISISINKNEVYVGIHAGTVDQRNQMMQFLKEQLSSRGCECVFEEV